MYVCLKAAKLENIYNMHGTKHPLFYELGFRLDLIFVLDLSKPKSTRSGMHKSQTYSSMYITHNIILVSYYYYY